MHTNGKKIEVISCIAMKSQVKDVLNAGADAIYAGLKKRSWYDSKIELSWEDIIEIADVIHSNGKKLYLAINRDLTTDDINEIIGYAGLFKNKTFDGLIISDWGCIHALRQISTDIEIHLSANTACINPSDFQMAKEMCIQRIVFSPSFKLNEIKNIADNYRDFQWEAITYGGKCFSEVSHCPCQVESNGKTFSNMCRYKYLLNGNGEGDKEPEAFGMPNLDGCIANILYDAGIYHWKIEGRAKGIKHIITGTKILRELADKIINRNRN